MQEMNQHLAQRLKGLRSELGWSLDVAARETGVSKAMLGQIERGEIWYPEGWEWVRQHELQHCKGYADLF